MHPDIQRRLAAIALRSSLRPRSALSARRVVVVGEGTAAALRLLGGLKAVRA